MRLVKNLEEFDDEVIYNSIYFNICDNPKNYEDITRDQMIDYISSFYKDYNNILSICTLKELNFLKRFIKGENIDEKNNYFVISSLMQKTILCLDGSICFDYLPSIKKALECLNAGDKKREEEIIIPAISLCKIYAEIPSFSLINILSLVVKKREDVIASILCKSKLFSYYVYTGEKKIPLSIKKVNYYIYQGYFNLLDDIEVYKKKYSNPLTHNFSSEELFNIFYYNFDISNDDINRMYKKLIKIDDYKLNDLVNEIMLLDPARDSLYTYLDLYNIDRGIFDRALDQIPLTSLGAITLREYNEYIQTRLSYSFINEKQRNACLNAEESSKFYDSYLSLLKYTSYKYKLNNVDINNLFVVDDFFWGKKKGIIDDYIKDNPTCDRSLLNIFKDGKRKKFIIVGFTRDYSMFLDYDNEIIYMVKGVTDNIQNIIPFLPFPIITTLIYFNGKLVYNGFFKSYPLEISTESLKRIKKRMDNSMKYYHL